VTVAFVGLGANLGEPRRQIEAALQELDRLSHTLDLLVYGNATLRTAVLEVPHPRMHERAFVLEPLREIAPDALIPGRGSASDLLARCKDQLVERMT
jgi:7,8-dihydro-6-hydroxymethylpterin-pyrophosphokinase